MPTQTNKFGFSKPLVNNATDADLWGGQLNTNWDDIDGLLAQTTSSKTTDFSVTSADFNKTFLIDATSNTVDATLPSTIPFSGFAIRFKAIDVTEVITIDGNGNTIDGSATFVLGTENETLTLVSNGTNWIINSAVASSETSAGVVEKASKSEMEGETAEKNVTADNFLNHPAAAKAWGVFDCTSGTVSGFDAKYNMASVSEAATGNYLLTLDNAMDSANYVVVAAAIQSAGIAGNVVCTIDVIDATTFIINTQNNSSQRDSKVYFAVYGTLA
jgi:hypothetical protein